MPRYYEWSEHNPPPIWNVFPDRNGARIGSVQGYYHYDAEKRCTSYRFRAWAHMNSALKVFGDTREEAVDKLVEAIAERDARDIR